MKEAEIRSQVLKKLDSNFNVYVGQVGSWLPWNPNPDTIEDQEYSETHLNTLVKKYKENQTKKDIFYEERKRDLQQAATEQNKIQSEKNAEEKAAAAEAAAKAAAEEAAEEAREAATLALEAAAEAAEAAAEAAAKATETKEETETIIDTTEPIPESATTISDNDFSFTKPVQESVTATELLNSL